MLRVVLVHTRDFMRKSLQKKASEAPPGEFLETRD